MTQAGAVPATMTNESKMPKPRVARMPDSQSDVSDIRHRTAATPHSN